MRIGFSEFFFNELERGARGLRIGFVRQFHEGDMSADRKVAAALERVSRVLTEEGAQLRTIKLPPLRALATIALLHPRPQGFAARSCAGLTPRSVPQIPMVAPDSAVNGAARSTTRNGVPDLRARRASTITGVAAPRATPIR